MEKHNPYLTRETVKELRRGAATEITGRYYDMVVEIVSVVSVQIIYFFNLTGSLF